MLTTLLSVFAVIFGLVTAYYKFAFKLSIFPSKPLDISNPFATPFVLKNDSLLWINNVRPYRVIIRNINKLTMKLNVELVAPPIPRLNAGETSTFILPVSKFVFTSEPINYINIEIVVFYYPAFISFYKKEKHSRFVTIQSKIWQLYSEFLRLCLNRYYSLFFFSFFFLGFRRRL